MNQHHINSELQRENNSLRAAFSEASALLADAADRLRSILDDTVIVEETPLEATSTMELVLETTETALEKLKAGRATDRLHPANSR